MQHGKCVIVFSSLLHTAPLCQVSLYKKWHVNLTLAFIGTFDTAVAVFPVYSTAL